MWKGSDYWKACRMELGQLEGKKGDQGLPSEMDFDWAERKTHGYHFLESEYVYDRLLIRNYFSLQIITRCYLKQTVSNVMSDIVTCGFTFMWSEKYNTKHDFQPSKSLSTKSSESEILPLMPNAFFLNIAFFPHYQSERASLLSLKKLVR